MWSDTSQKHFFSGSLLHLLSGVCSNRHGTWRKAHHDVYISSGENITGSEVHFSFWRELLYDVLKEEGACLLICIVGVSTRTWLNTNHAPVPCKSWYKAWTKTGNLPQAAAVHYTQWMSQVYIAIPHHGLLHRKTLKLWTRLVTS